MLRRELILTVQGAYFVVTGLWPVVHMPSFEAITGPKVDDWLVKMVGLLAAVIGGTLYTAARGRNRSYEILLLAIASALAFTMIDTWYSVTGRISLIYLADAVVEIAIVVLLVRARWSEP
jgi:hypothetical protein